MVLQRDVELDIWGWADPGTWVTVRFNGAYYEALTGEDGKWMVTMPPQPAGFNAKGYVSPGTGHEFQTWRRSLLEMAPMLFKK